MPLILHITILCTHACFKLYLQKKKGESIIEDYVYVQHEGTSMQETKYWYVLTKDLVLKVYKAHEVRATNLLTMHSYNFLLYMPKSFLSL